MIPLKNNNKDAGPAGNPEGPGQRDENRLERGGGTKNDMSRWKAFLGKKENLVLLILGGILLMVIAMPATRAGSANTLGYVGKTEAAAGADAGAAAAPAGTCGLERRLEEILEEMEGCRKAKVMITFQNDAAFNAKSYDYCYVYPEVCGIVAVIEGDAGAETEEKITYIIQALFSLEAHKIRVVNRKT